MQSENLKYALLIGITLLSAFVISFVLRKIFNLFIRKYTKKLNADPTNFSFLKNSIGFIIYTSAIVFIFYRIPYLRSIGTALFAGAGILAVAVGFASQKAFSNIISGIFILIFKPFKVTDIIEFKDGQKGLVEEITLRHTIIKDYENRRIIIPNSIISEETIINSNIQDEKIRKHLQFSISYESSIDQAIDIIRSEAEAHPYCIDNRSKEDIEKGTQKVSVRVIELAESSVEIKAFIWSNNNDEAFLLKCDLLKSIKERFQKEGVEIPYPHRVIVRKS